MNDILRQKLKELIQQFGTSLSEDRLRCLGMLMDVCGDCKREIAGIMAALEEKIPERILKPDFTVVITRKLLIKKLEDNRAIAHEVAEWSVDSWAIALGVITESQIPAGDEETPPPVIPVVKDMYDELGIGDTTNDPYKRPPWGELIPPSDLYPKLRLALLPTFHSHRRYHTDPTLPLDFTDAFSGVPYYAGLLERLSDVSTNQNAVMSIQLIEGKSNTR